MQTGDQGRSGSSPSAGARSATKHARRLHGSSTLRTRRLLQPSSWRLSTRGLCATGVCVIVAATVIPALLLTNQRARVASSADVERLQVQAKVVKLLTGIPQHGVILGQQTAPVTLQVFIDLEDHGDGTRWFDIMLPSILEHFVRTNVVRLEFHSFKSDTLNRRPFYLQQIAALAAGAQNLLWNYVATFINEQGTEFTNYVTKEFVSNIAEQIPGLNLAKWENTETIAMAKIVEADLITARDVGFHDSPAFRIGPTGGKMKDFSGRHVATYHKYIVRTRPSGERYIAGVSSEWQHPVSLIETADVKKAIEELI